ncbi:MAG: redox-regulated ATPase YchF [Candidatus Buchananbacteria bacterium]
MSLAVGIVGLPNVGKSTLFKALTKKQVDIANYPFCTIDPNVGVVAVPDERLEVLTKLNNSAKTIYTTIEFVDIAGLVKGASLGEGLGNKFLSHIREVDAIVQVLRNFSDKNIIHVQDRVDPEADKEIINLELILADLATVTKRCEGGIKTAQANKDAKLLAYYQLLEKLKQHLEAGLLAQTLDLTEEEKLALKDLQLLTFKPQFYVYNIAEEDIKNFATHRPNDLYISAKIEAELSELEPAEAKNYLQELGLAQSGLDQLIKVAYQNLDLITFLTTGTDETRAWTIKRGSKAPQAAGAIHTDFERGFIRAEVIAYADFIKAGSELKAKELGLMRLEGKDYVVQDGDICNFRFSV